MTTNTEPGGHIYSEADHEADATALAAMLMTSTSLLDAARIALREMQRIDPPHDNFAKAVAMLAAAIEVADGSPRDPPA